jgi:Domain of unknown function (DUF4232)
MHASDGIVRGLRLLGVCVASLAALLAISACGGSTRSDGGQAMPAATGLSAIPSATAPDGPSATATDGRLSSATNASKVSCRTARLRLSLAAVGAATGTSYSWYYLSNIGHVGCSMIGFPGVAILDIRGRIVQHPAAWSTHPGTTPPEPVRLVPLKPGQPAKFLLASTDAIPNRDCRTAYTGRSLQLFPPNEATPIRQPYHRSFCDLVVGPVQRAG